MCRILAQHFRPVLQHTTVSLIHRAPESLDIVFLHSCIVTLHIWFRDFYRIDSGCKFSPPALREGAGVGASDTIAYGAAGGVVKNETCGGCEGDVGDVPEVGADGAGGLVVEGGVDGGEELGGLVGEREGREGGLDEGEGRVGGRTTWRPWSKSRVGS